MVLNDEGDVLVVREKNGELLVRGVKNEMLNPSSQFVARGFVGIRFQKKQ